MSLIKLRDVSFQYEKSGEKALQEINLSLERGEYVAIIGANGSGKSTLARLLNVLLQPTAGKVMVDGLDTQKSENIRQIRRQVGMVFQNPDNQLVATMVEDDVAFGLENLGVPSRRIKKRVDQALNMVDMEDYRRHPPHKLSGGQKQRVAIAGIIAMEPSCIVLDEPTAMLDPRGRKEVLTIVDYLNREKNITIVYITHFMRQAVRADKIFVMSEGKIVHRGSPEKIFADPKILQDIGLKVPPVTELALELKQRGLSLPPVMTVKELVKELC